MGEALRLRALRIPGDRARLAHMPNAHLAARENPVPGFPGLNVAGEEGALLARLRSGDSQAFEGLVRSAGPRLLAVTRRMLRNEQDAQDAVQDAFLSAFRALHRFDGQCQL